MPEPFPIYAPMDVEVDYERLKRIKVTIPGLPKVQFISATKHTGERILSFETPPGGRDGWICDYFLVTESTTDDRLGEAIWWVLSGQNHPGGVTVLDLMKNLLGPEVREISPRELEAEEKLRGYLDRTK